MQIYDALGEVSVSMQTGPPGLLRTELWVLPVQMCYKEMQGPVVGWRQLPEKVSDL